MSSFARWKVLALLLNVQTTNLNAIRFAKQLINQSVNQSSLQAGPKK